MKTIDRLLRWALRQTTHPHWDGQCGRWSGWHDEGMPMVCNRRSGHFGPWHYDSLNGLVWRSGEEPTPPCIKLRDATEILWRSAHDAPLVILDVTDARREDPPAPGFVDSWRDGSKPLADPGFLLSPELAAMGRLLVLEDRLVQATAIQPDAYIVPGEPPEGLTIHGHPVIRGDRLGIVFYTEEPHVQS